MKRRYPLFVALGLCAIALVGALCVWGVKARQEAAQLAGIPTLVGWQPGTQYIFKIRWEASRALALAADANGGAGSLDAAADIGGELLLRCLRKEGDRAILAATLRNVDRHYYRLFNDDMLVDPAIAKEQLEGRELVLEVDPRGHLVKVHRKPDESAVFVSILQSILLRAQLTLPAPAAREWDAAEPTTEGVSRVLYKVDATSPSVKLTRSRVAYDTIEGLPSSQRVETHKLDASAAIELDANGIPAQLRDKEALEVFGTNREQPVLKTTSDLTWTKVGEGPLEGEVQIAMADWVAQEPTAVMDNQQDTEKMLLERRVAGLTLMDMVDGIELFAAAGMIPDKQRWMVRATGLLRLHPEYCDSLLAVFEQDLMSTQGRALILDLLVSVGHPRAQAVMRDAIASEAARAEAEQYPLLVQRFLFLEHPEAQTASFLLKQVEAAERAGGPELAAYANSLASVAGTLAKQGDQQASAYNQKVVDLLKGASTPEERQGYLRALGNAGLPANAPLLREYADDDDATVRSAAAYALRTSNDTESRRTLSTMTSDVDRRVTDSALSALEQQKLSRDEVEQLAKLVVQGSTNPASDGQMAMLLAPYVRTSEMAKQALVALLARNQDRSDVAAKIVNVLRGAGV